MSTPTAGTVVDVYSGDTCVFPTYTFLTEAPVYVNPGEFVAIVAKKVGTVATAGVISYVIRFDYSWE